MASASWVVRRVLFIVVASVLPVLALVVPAGAAQGRAGGADAHGSRLAAGGRLD
jgi:hypothetical protein